MSGTAGSEKKPKGPEKAPSQLRRVADSTSDLSTTYAKHHTEEFIKTTNNPEKTPRTYLMKLGSYRDIIDMEMFLLNLLQAFHPVQTKARLFKHHSQENLLIEKLPADYQPLQDCVQDPDKKQRIHNAIKSGQSGLGELLPVMFLFHEIDAKLGNFFYSDQTQKIVRIDMDWAYAGHLDPTYYNTVSPADLQNILAIQDYGAYSWMGYLGAKQIYPHNHFSDLKLYSPKFIAEIHRGILQVLLLPPEVIQVFANQYLSHPLDRHSKIEGMLTFQKKIRQAALQDPEFLSYLKRQNITQQEQAAQLPTPREDATAFIAKLEGCKLNKATPLPDLVRIPRLVNAALRNLQAEAELCRLSDNGTIPLSKDRAQQLHRYLLHVAATMPHTEYLQDLITQDREGTQRCMQDDTGKTPLHLAAELHQTQNMQDLITQDTLDAIDNEGNTPLLLAVRASKIAPDHSAIQLLYDHEANYLHQNHKGLSVLHYAVANRDKPLIDVLAHQKEVCNLRDKNGQTPLHYAAQLCTKHNFTESLITAENIDMQDGQGKTPLHYAIEQRNSEIITILLTQGASLEIADKQGKNALHYAHLYGYGEDFTTQEERELINDQDQDGRTVLHHAILSHHPKDFGYLLSNQHSLGLNITLLDNHKKTGLDYAQALLDNTLDEHGRNGLHNAYLYGYGRLLTNNNTDIDINAPDATGKTVLHHAIIANTQEDIEHLLQNHQALGLNLTLKDHNGKTALHYAFEKHNRSVITALLQQSDLHITDIEGKNGLQYAYANGMGRLLTEKYKDLVTAKDLKGRTVLHHAVLSGNQDDIDYLLKNKTELGLSLNAQDLSGKTALHYAFEKCDKQTIKKLLDHKAAMDIEDAQGKTALHYAYMNGLGKYFTPKTAIMSARDNDGRTILHHAIISENQADIEHLLENYASLGLDLDGRDNEGKTALHYAIEKRNLSVIHKILTEDADLRIKDHYGRNSLHYAYIQGIGKDIPIDKHRGIINMQDDAQKTVLHYAAIYYNLDDFQYLIDNKDALGLDVHLRDQTGKTALDYKLENDRRNTPSAISTASGKTATPPAVPKTPTPVKFFEQNPASGPSRYATPVSPHTPRTPRGN